MISPYAKPGLIAHTPYEFASLLKFVETRYGLAPLTARDQDANDLLDSFDFEQVPQPPLILQPHPCLVVAVNAGGDAYTAADGTAYQADTRFTGGHTATTRATIADTTDQALYQSAREGDFS